MPANVITKGRGSGGSVCVCEGGMIAMHATTKRTTLKSYYQKKRTVWQIYGGGQLAPYVCGDGDSESGCNYQSSSGKCCQNAKAGLCRGVAMETGPLPEDYVFTKTLKIYTCVFIAHLQKSCKWFPLLRR